MKIITVRINFDFPKSEYPYLKLLCAKKGVTIKKLATELLIKAIEDYEDEEIIRQINDGMEKTNDI